MLNPTSDPERTISDVQQLLDSTPIESIMSSTFVIHPLIPGKLKLIHLPITTRIDFKMNRLIKNHIHPQIEDMACLPNRGVESLVPTLDMHCKSQCS